MLDSRSIVTGLVVAAGSGTRLAGDGPKGFRRLGSGPLFLHSLTVLDRAPSVRDLVLVVPAGFEDSARRASAGVIRKPLMIVTGGRRRQDSVLLGLEAAATGQSPGQGFSPSEERRLVAVHDAARPFVTPDLIERCAAVARERGAAIPHVSVSDTVRESGDGRPARIVDRKRLRLAQTPQVARLDWLLEGYRAAVRNDTEVTDEGVALQEAGFAWMDVEGARSNVKITTQEDLEVADAILAARHAGAPARLRIGIGEDRHPRAPERPFVVAGVVLDETNGPVGHSDGDPLCHALIDALLGASSGGSIGDLFPDTDPRWAGSSGLDLLARASQSLSARGWRVVNVDAVLILDTPRLGPRALEIRERLAKTLGLDIDRVSVKGKRAEGLGFEGTAGGVSCRAVALIEGGES